MWYHSYEGMKLQKQKAYRYKGREHYKYVIVVPEVIVDNLTWKEGDELVAEAKQGKLVIGKIQGKPKLA
jgi:hypothetical protein